MFCQKCGMELPEDANFCGACGFITSIENTEEIYDGQDVQAYCSMSKKEWREKEGRREAASEITITKILVRLSLILAIASRVFLLLLSYPNVENLPENWEKLMVEQFVDGVFYCIGITVVLVVLASIVIKENRIDISIVYAFTAIRPISDLLNSIYHNFFSLAGRETRFETIRYVVLAIFIVLFVWIIAEQVLIDSKYKSAVGFVKLDD